MTVQISELPLTAQNLYPQVFHTIDIQGEEAKNNGKEIPKGFIEDPQKLQTIDQFEKQYLKDAENEDDDAIQEKLIKDQIKEEIKENPDKIIDSLYKQTIKKQNKSQINQNNELW